MMLKTRKQQRWLSLGFLLAAGGVLVWFGLHGRTLKSLPEHYIGLLFLGFAVLGACGVNVWRGGPLDPRLDTGPRPDTSNPELPLGFQLKY